MPPPFGYNPPAGSRPAPGNTFTGGLAPEPDLAGLAELLGIPVEMARELYGQGGPMESQDPLGMPGIPEIPPLDFDVPLPPESDLSRTDPSVEADIQGFATAGAGRPLPPQETPLAEDLWEPIQEEMDAQQEEMDRIQRTRLGVGESADVMAEEETLRNMMEMMIPRRRPAEFPSGDLDPYMTEDFDPLGRAQDYRRSVDVPPRPPETIDLPPGAAGRFDLLYRLGEGMDPDRKHIDVTREILGAAPEMRRTLEDIERPDLSEFYGRPRYEGATAVMVRVPPQLYGKFGFSDDPIQKVSPEQASKMAEYKSMTAEEDAIRAYKESGTTPAMFGEDFGPSIGPEETKFRGYRYVPRTLRRDQPMTRR